MYLTQKRMLILFFYEICYNTISFSQNRKDKVIDNSNYAQKIIFASQELTLASEVGENRKAIKTHIIAI